MIISLQSITKNFEGGIAAVGNVSLEVGDGEFIALVGASGCGKSTLLRIIAGLLPPTSGEIRVSTDNIGFVFQEPTLLDWLSVFDNIWLPLRLKGVSKEAASPSIMAEISRLGLLEFAHAKPPTLSGGMKMRVALARALITKPSLLLMDEPFAALDEMTRFKLNDDLLALQKTSLTTVVFVTHSIYEAVNLASRVVVLSPRPALVLGEVMIGEKPLGFRHSALFFEKTRVVSSLLGQI